MLIYHCVSCDLYELRHAWEVSSIVEQYGDHMPDIFLDVAILKGNDSPLRYPERLATTKNWRVTLRYFPTDRETFAKRGLVRNEQVARALAAKADWIYFADCDRTYHPTFFSELCRLLKKNRRCEKLVAQRLRQSTELEPTNALIEDGRADGPHHTGAYIRTSELPIAWHRNYPMATGGMQVVRAGFLRKIGPYYIPPDRCRDRHLFNRGQRAFSDLHFRHRFGGSLMLPLPPSLHLEHRRDKEAGKHLTEQR